MTTPAHPIQVAELPVVRARGSPRARGRQIGEAAAPLILRMLGSYRELIEASRPRINTAPAKATTYQ